MDTELNKTGDLHICEVTQVWQWPIGHLPVAGGPETWSPWAIRFLYQETQVALPPRSSKLTRAELLSAVQTQGEFIFAILRCVETLIGMVQRGEYEQPELLKRYMAKMDELTSKGMELAEMVINLKLAAQEVEEREEGEDLAEMMSQMVRRDLWN
ncbi:hypothetical protein FZEAL_3908 [Fusarium zealandicum]|uniref:Uncharacterized protein n=1 Tax=Fusarium zealandicum TaxID=1053134 RepID=A0A8H4XLE2_9HYPO|nr:hypothetical protein FZEAL_3908 [Fusarium zealandicum]